MGTHKDLDVWKRAMDLVDVVYDCTELFPKDEIYGLCSQMRRCAVSIPSNIAEGCGRNNKGELIQFIGVARGSLAELETQLIIANRRLYISDDMTFKINAHIQDISKMFYRWHGSFKRAA